MSHENGKHRRISPGKEDTSSNPSSAGIYRLYPERRRKDRRSGADRRAGQDRRIGEERRIEQVSIPFPDHREKGERRSGHDRRVTVDRREGERRERSLRIPISIKLASLYILLILFVISTISFLILGKQKAQFQDQLMILGTTTVRLIAHNAADKLLGEDEIALFKLVRDCMENEDVLSAAITDHRGIIRAHSRADKVGEPYSAPKDLLFLKEDMGVRMSLLHHGGSDVLHLEIPIIYQKLKVGEVRLVVSQERIHEAIRRARLFLLVLTVGITLGGTVLSLGLSTYFSHPIKKLGESIRAIGAGQFEYRVQIHRNDEFGDLAYAFNRMAEDLELNEKIKGSFGRYITPEIVTMILADPDNPWMKSSKVEASVLFVDIRGFTALSEGREPGKIVDLLNAYFTRVTDVVIHYGGYLNKFVGDAAMAVFGAPATNPQHAETAVRAALDIRKEIARFNSERPVLDVTVQVGIGVNSGEMVAGTVGSKKRLEYTVIGDNVNVASRLTSIARPGEILISRETFVCIQGIPDVTYEGRGEISFKGRERKVEVYSLISPEDGEPEG